MKLAVFGAKGRVGKSVCKIAKERKHTVVSIEKGDDLCATEQVDIVVDFSTAEATRQVCDFCRKMRCPLVTGVTGRNENQQRLLDELKNSIEVCESANFSIGIDAMRKVCKVLARLGWDCEIVETHRKQKADCPSGTAKLLACDIMQNGTRIVHVHSLRCGSNFGKHQVVFATDGESITVTHQAENVEIFALGAVRKAEEMLQNKTN